MGQKCKKSVERGWIFIYLERQVACGVGDSLRRTSIWSEVGGHLGERWYTDKDTAG